IIGVESKSFSGDFARTEIVTGRAGVKPHPKDDHLLQVSLYLDNFVNMPYFNLIYVDRETFDRAEYKIELIEEGGDKFPKITYSDRSSYIDYRISIAGIYDRYKTLMWNIKRDILPASDYRPLMTKAYVDEQFKDGEISKGQYKKFIDGDNLTTDWRCRYCSHVNLCRGIDQKPIKKFNEKYSAGELKEYTYPKE
ncbi:MAG: hypothetical protein ACREBJ_07510, partial [Nitrosotalea sp.]